MAYFPALKFNIQGRGLIKKNYFADLVVFDFEKLKDLSTYDNPKRLSEGIKYVFVNGKLSFYDNKVVSKNGIVIYS
jgi:N-acyl-D-amino-acid deacylase